MRGTINLKYSSSGTFELRLSPESVTETEHLKLVQQDQKRRLQKLEERVQPKDFRSVQDHQFSATSFLSNHDVRGCRVGFVPPKKSKNGQLGGWSPEPEDENPCISVDFETVKQLVYIQTQGMSNVDQWVKVYTLRSSLDGDSFEEIGTFVGNKDRNSIVGHALPPVCARYIRLYPEGWNIPNPIGLRWNIFFN